jgi:hypothetical protein
MKHYEKFIVRNFQRVGAIAKTMRDNAKRIRVFTFIDNYDRFAIKSSQHLLIRMM